MEKKQITLQIDRHYITVPEGATILEAARKIGIDIPTLCHIDRRVPASRTTPHRAASVWLKWKDGATSPPPAPPAVRRGWWCVPAPCA